MVGSYIDIGFRFLAGVEFLPHSEVSMPALERHHSRNLRATKVKSKAAGLRS